MGTLLRAPDAVLEAREAKKGLHFVLEILVFVAVFFVCTVGEVLVLLPVQTVMLMRDQEYQRAALSGYLERAMEYGKEYLEKYAGAKDIQCWIV